MWIKKALIIIGCFASLGLVAIAEGALPSEEAEIGQYIKEWANDERGTIRNTVMAYGLRILLINPKPRIALSPSSCAICIILMAKENNVYTLCLRKAS